MPDELFPGAASVESAFEHLLAAGDHVLIVDEKRRSQMIELKVGARASTHQGFLEHDDMIGLPSASKVFTNKGSGFWVVRPSLAEAISAMPRGAQVIYPKDLGKILMAADVRPGMKVLESGLGSGALSMALLNAGALVTGYELRSDFANRARNNVRTYLGGAALESYKVELRDIYDGIDGGPYERVLLDLPEPWLVIERLPGQLVAGGILLAYQTSVGQLEQFRRALAEGGFVLPETTEVLERKWYFSRQALRPEHSMVAHTGFLTWARMPPAGA